MVSKRQKKSKSSWRTSTRRRARISFAVRDATSPWQGGKEPVFLNLTEVVAIHSDQIRHYGGAEGVRDMALLQSAVAQPEAGLGGQWLHDDLYEMAAAYAFHICGNHPFLDGNKRTALAIGLVFLEINGISLSDPKGILLKIVLDLAKGNLGKKELADVFRTLPKDE